MADTGASTVLIDTTVGTARLDLDLRVGGKLLIIGHGAGGDVAAADLVAVADACAAKGISVVRVTQPYRVSGRKAPPAATTLDRAWRDVAATLMKDNDRPVIFGGRSSGARVACRCADAGAVAVIALAFPVHPPGQPMKSRLPELEAVGVPLLVVQGASDPFGQPTLTPASAGINRTIVTVAGDHSLRKSALEVGTVVADWISALD